MANSFYQDLASEQGRLVEVDRHKYIKENLKSKMDSVIQDIKDEDSAGFTAIYMGNCATDAEVTAAVANGDFKRKNVSSIKTFINASTANYKFAHLLFPQFLHDQIRDVNSCTCTGDSFQTVPPL